MQYFLQAPSIFFFMLLLLQSASSTPLHPHKHQHRHQHAKLPMVEIPLANLQGVEILGKSICTLFPNNIHTPKRETLSLSVPEDELLELFSLIKNLEEQTIAAISALLQKNSLDNSTASPSGAAADTKLHSLEADTTSITNDITTSAQAASKSALFSAATPSTTAPGGAILLEQYSPKGAASSTASSVTERIQLISTSALPSAVAPSAVASSTAASVDVFNTTTAGGPLASISPTNSPVTSSKNVAVYYGQTPATSTTALEDLCASDSTSIVILAFVTTFSPTSFYPTVNFGAACGGQTSMMTAEAPGLLSCPALAGNITTCQTKYGKKVLLSLGGATGQISFDDAAQATGFGTMLWKLFGPGGGIDNDLRPFGNVEIDGFDFDNEDLQPANWDIFGQTLRSYYSSAKKQYYLSSAPQCPYPDASNPLSLLLICDFVFVQFFNNAPCEIGSSGFLDSVKQWSKVLDDSTLASKTKFYVGAPAFSVAGPSAYASMGGPEGITNVMESVKGLELDNFGGVMFWDGSEGSEYLEGGKSIIDWAKQALT